jgi:hypothetical protein|tara:strand:+ start:733 stop:1656 length:924 start_codon:yes stop_codon:yes gene_type:complete
MQLSKAINSLLYTNDCVTVPGFGSFIVNKFSSVYDEKNGKFYPPSRRVSFNSKIKNNDGLLANFISNEDGIDFSVAVKNIHNEVINWKKKLNKEPLVLNNIGELSYNSDENIVFSPDLDSNHFLGSFGLPSIYYKKQPDLVSTYNESTLKKYNDLKVNSSNSRVPDFVKYAAALVIIISTTFFLSKEYEEYNIQNQLILEQENRQKTIQRVESAVFDFGSIPAIELEIKVQPNKFHIIAGAFGVKSNADKLYNNLLSKGYNPTKLPLNDKGLIPISFDNFSNRKEAVIALRQLQMSENKDAWIFVLE